MECSTNKIEICDGSAIIKVNPSLYSSEVIYSAAYVFLDRAYVLLDGDLEKEILLTLKPRGDENPEKLANEFFNELINYADYNVRAKKTKILRETILQRALITNDPSIIEKDGELNELLEEDSECECDCEDESEDLFDDPENIAIPWEEKYGASEDENKVE